MHSVGVCDRSGVVLPLWIGVGVKCGGGHMDMFECWNPWSQALKGLLSRAVAESN